MNQATAISARALTKRFRGQGVDAVAVDAVDVTVAKGSVFALLGPNGAGKTTLVRMLTTLLAPDGGSAVVAGFDVAKDPQEVRRRIGLVGQYASVDELLTGRQNLWMMGRLFGLSSRDAKARADELLGRFDLEDAAGKIAKSYSGGMRRRLDLAASLVLAPEILFLDEPTTGLDPRSRAATWDLIHDMTRDEGTTVLLTTQYLEEADQFAQRIAILDKGRVVAEGTSTELKARVRRSTLVVKVSARITEAAALSTFVALGAKPQTKLGEVHAPVDDVGHAAALMKALHDAGAALDDVAFLQTSLDDVFFQLTGNAAA